MDIDWIRIVQDVVPPLSIFLANVGFICWFRSESREDWRRMDAKMDSYRQESNAQLNSYRQESNSKIDAIQNEIKDFHGRLCVIAERGNKNG